jgi:hypothetical protein
VSVRRLFAVAIALVWLLPTAMAGAIALHVAFEHHADDPHASTLHRLDRAELAGDGHVHSTGDVPHHHPPVAAPADAVPRRVLDPGSLPCRSAEAAGGSTAALDPALERRARPLLEPPRASGPPLLARLSTLRI